jgi:hypothetical protein
LHIPDNADADEFLAEAYKLLASDDVEQIELPDLPYTDLANTRPAAGLRNTTYNKPPASPTPYSSNIGGPRTRPLPSNLLDDD